MPKIIRILRSCSKKIFPTVNISKLIFLLLICNAKNFIWTTLKMIFLIFRFFCTLRFQIFKYCPIITNHTSMERLFIQIDPYGWFCAPGSHMQPISLSWTWCEQHLICKERIRANSLQRCYVLLSLWSGIFSCIFITIRLWYCWYVLRTKSWMSQI